ncbi:MAG TPA: glycosyltransferase, partial [Candidatus Dormibacteraeota bacterium]|nr:glycosyltransferase [Candidatus Dormibacteraeota bacterium]
MASISVVLPTRNRPAFLREALATVAAQSHLEIELVLVRD